MTVKQLIEELQQLDPNLHVFTRGYEGGYEEVEISEEREIALNVHSEWYYGPHERTDYSLLGDKSKYTIVKAVIL